MLGAHGRAGTICNEEEKLVNVMLYTSARNPAKGVIFRAQEALLVGGFVRIARRGRRGGGRLKGERRLQCQYEQQRNNCKASMHIYNATMYVIFPLRAPS